MSTMDFNRHAHAQGERGGNTVLMVDAIKRQFLP
jgi:hypothetical protein